jgi:hypothetical protein
MAKYIPLFVLVDLISSLMILRPLYNAKTFIGALNVGVLPVFGWVYCFNVCKYKSKVASVNDSILTSVSFASIQEPYTVICFLGFSPYGTVQ